MSFFCTCGRNLAVVHVIQGISKSATNKLFIQNKTRILYNSHRPLPLWNPRGSRFFPRKPPDFEPLEWDYNITMIFKRFRLQKHQSKTLGVVKKGNNKRITWVFFIHTFHFTDTNIKESPTKVFFIFLMKTTSTQKITRRIRPTLNWCKLVNSTNQPHLLAAAVNQWAMKDERIMNRNR